MDLVLVGPPVHEAHAGGGGVVGDREAVGVAGDRRPRGAGGGADELLARLLAVAADAVVLDAPLAAEEGDAPRCVVHGLDRRTQTGQHVSAMAPKASRILALLETLQDRPAATGPELAATLGVDVRTVRRDV